MDTKIIGSKIAEARKKINFSQAQLAQHLFISSQAVGKWERGESIPDIITFNRLAKVLGVDLNYFSEDFQTSTEATAANEGMKAEPAPTDTEEKLSWDMSSGNWVGNDFSGLKNLHEKFSGSNMQNCIFIGSDLSGLLLKSNNVKGCDFSNSDISKSHFQNSHLVNNQFKECSLHGAELSGNHIRDCDFSGADFTGAKIKACDFQKNSIENAVWHNTSFKETHIGNIVFEGTIKDCAFESCGFSGVKFQNSTLINTFFKHNHKLKKVSFIDCKADKLTYAFLKNEKADLSGITLLTA